MEKPVIFHSQGQAIFANLSLPYIGAPCIIMSHGLEGSKDADKWLLLTSRLYDAGFACLRFNYRGCGEGREKSEGKFEDTTLSGRIQDYQAALDFVETTDIDKDRLGVIGSSFGGTVAIAAQDTRVKAMVTMATPCRFKLPTEEQLRVYQTRGFFDLPSDRRLKTRFLHDIQRYNVCHAAGKIDYPVLIIHGSADADVPVENAHDLYKKARGPKRLKIIEGGNHGFNNPAHLEQVISLACDWLRRYL